MPVERRYSKRYPMDGDVYIRYRKQRAFPAKAVNCSMQGMYLKTQSLTLLTGALVELEIYRDGNFWEIMGIVTHAEDEGVGIMFWQPQPDLYESVVARQPRVSDLSQPAKNEGFESRP